MNTKLWTKAKIDFEKEFFKLWILQFFGKIVGNLRKHIDIKLVTTNERTNYLVSEPNYDTIKWFQRKFISNRNKKNKNE